MNIKLEATADAANGKGFTLRLTAEDSDDEKILKILDEESNPNFRGESAFSREGEYLTIEPGLINKSRSKRPGKGRIKSVSMHVFRSQRYAHSMFDGIG